MTDAPSYASLSYKATAPPCEHCGEGSLKLTPDQFGKVIGQIGALHSRVPAEARGYMVKVMCRVLRGLGYEQGVTIFENLQKK